MGAFAKMAPLLLCWAGIGLALARAFADRRKATIVGGVTGFACGVGTAFFLLSSFKGGLPFSVVKTVVGFSFLILFAGSVATLYRTAGVTFAIAIPARFKGTPFLAGAAAFFAGMLAGALMACKIPMETADNLPLLAAVLIALSGALLLLAASFCERFLPEVITLTGDALLLTVVSLLLLISSFTPRLDLFSPLTMKVMKFIHDFVHQFFESMLIPDHPFFRPDVWNYIGLLFGSGVGFWGGLAIWLAPAFLILWALWRERLPSVAHFRQGAKRRKLLAGYIRERRWRLVVPWFAFFVLAAAVYKSRFPAVEYWDPKPVPVTAAPDGTVSIPRKSGEIDLEDGKLHKFVLRQGDKRVRFFVLMKPEGQLTVVLDACSICQPDGYGQSEGTVICYYCKTLIPIETVGKPGGCNPVPLTFSEDAKGVRISGQTLVHTWDQTVQVVKKGPGGGR